MCNIVLCIFHPAQQVDESSWSITSPEFFIFNSVFLIDSQIAKQKLEIHPLVALHTTIATTHPSTPDLPPASISLFNHTDTLPPRSFKPPTSFTSTPRRQPLPLFVAPLALHLLLWCHTPLPRIFKRPREWREVFTGAWVEVTVWCQRQACSPLGKCQVAESEGWLLVGRVWP